MLNLDSGQSIHDLVLGWVVDCFYIMGKSYIEKWGPFLFKLWYECVHKCGCWFTQVSCLFSILTLYWNYKLWLDFNIPRTISWGFEREHLCNLIPTNIGIAEFFPQKYFILVPMPAHLGKVTWQQNLVILPSDPFFLLYPRGFSLIVIIAWQKIYQTWQNWHVSFEITIESWKIQIWVRKQIRCPRRRRRLESSDFLWPTNWKPY
jgi:hypothetical protein